MAETEHKKVGRNDRCHCGSGKKYKQCCLAKDEAAERALREKAAAKAAKAAAKAAEAEPREDKGAADKGAADRPAASPAARHQSRHATEQPWKRGAQNARGSKPIGAPRKVGGGG